MTGGRVRVIIAFCRSFFCSICSIGSASWMKSKHHFGQKNSFVCSKFNRKWFVTNRSVVDMSTSSRFCCATPCGIFLSVSARSHISFISHVEVMRPVRSLHDCIRSRSIRFAWSQRVHLVHRRPVRFVRRKSEQVMRKTVNQQINDKAQRD